jgi:replicative DNA helicase
MSNITDAQIRDVLFTPNDASRLALQTIEQRRSEKGIGIRFGVKCVDEYMIPLRPGELVGVLGMTSNYKTGTMQFWARQAAEQVEREGIENRVVVYVTWEQAVEEVVALDLAASCGLSATDLFMGKVTDEAMGSLRIGAMKRAIKPLWIVGHSISEGKARPALTLSNLYSALKMMRDVHKLSPYAIFLDYLQQIEPEDGQDRRMQVFYNVYKCKDMSLEMGCPVVLGSQAGRQAYESNWGIPPITSSLESSNFEHTCDKIFGVWLPIKNYEAGEIIKAKVPGGDQQLEVSENLLVMKQLKQKFGPAGRWWPLYVDPAKNVIGEMASKERGEMYWNK